MRSTENMNKVTEIKDSYFVSYGVFYSMGVLIFVPHKFFMIATDYWMFKFRDPHRWKSRPTYSFHTTPFPHLPYVPTSDVKESGPARERTPLQASFTSSFFITCQVSLLAFLVVTWLFSKRMPPPPKRIKGALLAMLVLFLINTAFTKINTDSFQKLFFAITMVLAILLNLCSAVTMLSLFELVTKFPFDYYGTILSGQSICGVISSVVQIFSLSMHVHSVYSGLVFFGVGSLIILATTIFYLVTKKKSQYFIYRISQYEGTTCCSEEPKPRFNMEKMKAALQRSKWFLGAMVFVQGSTAMVFPGLAALIVSVDKDSGLGDEWNTIYFVPVITFLGFHFFDFVGREVARKIKRPRGAFAILTLATVRLVVVPLMMLCNAQPRKRMPVFFEDNVYMFLISLFGFTQGFLVNLCIISVPRVAKKEELEFVTVLVPLFSILSVTLCSAFNLVIISLI